MSGFSGKIEHIVVLMLENRSFDNILGQLYRKFRRYAVCDQRYMVP